MKTSVAREAEGELVCKGCFIDVRLRGTAGTVVVGEAREVVVDLDRAPTVEMVAIVHKESAGIRRAVGECLAGRLFLEVSREISGHLGISSLRERRDGEERQRRHKQTYFCSHFELPPVFFGQACLRIRTHP